MYRIIWTHSHTHTCTHPSGDMCVRACVFDGSANAWKWHGRRGFLLSYPLTACRLLFKWHLLFVEPNVRCSQFSVRIHNQLWIDDFLFQLSAAFTNTIPHRYFNMEICHYKKQQCEMRERKRGWNVCWTDLELRMVVGEFSIMDITLLKSDFACRTTEVNGGVRTESPWCVGNYRIKVTL